MKKTVLLLYIAFCFISANAQYNTLYETSFNNWLPHQGWVMLSNDTIPASPGLLMQTATGVGTNPTTEIINHLLGISRNGLMDKIIFTPPIPLGNNPYLRCYLNPRLYNSGTGNISLWLIHNPNDTTLAGLTDSITSFTTEKFNTLNLNSAANTTVRIAFRIRGTNCQAAIDDVLFLDKYALAYISDSCFRTKLQTIVPSGFIGDSLDYTNNSVINLRRINATNGCIQSLEGLQYFPFLKSINFTNNSISYFPYVPFRYIDTLIAANNFISYLPDFPKCTYVDMNNNLLHHFFDYFNNYLAWMKVRNNLIYDCFRCSNRFAYADFYGNPKIVQAGCTYYYLTFFYNNLPNPPCINRTHGLITGTVFYDANQNEIKDTNEYAIPNQRLNYQLGTDVYTNYLGRYSIEADSGVVLLNATQLPTNFTCSNPLVDTITTNQTIHHNFAIKANTIIDDLKIDINSSGTTNLNQNLILNITVKNIGTVINDSGVVKMYIPPGYTLLSLSDGAIINDTLIWNVAVNPFFSKNNQLIIRITNYTPNQIYNFIASIYTPDSNLSNNTSNINVFIRPALANFSPWDNNGFPYDPNNKLVSTPRVLPGFNNYLTYNINFQNIGTANATRVIVRDFLPPQLDASTLEIISTSHPCVVALGNDSLIEFVFKPITLTPLSVDSINSEGHIWFRIKTKNAINLGDTINNSAGIYFDDQPVVNTGICKVWAENTDANFMYQNDICANTPIQFLDQSSGIPISWNWNFPGGNPSSSTLKNPIVTYNTAGAHNATLITTWSHGIDTITQNVFTSSILNAVVSQLGNATFCENETLTLTANHSFNYLWNNNETTQSISPTNSGNYSVTITDSLGCTATSIPVMVSVIPLTSHLEIISQCIPFLLNEQSYTSSGTYTQTLTNSNGCDSLLTLNLTIANPTSNTINQTACESYTLNSQTYTSSGTYTQTLINANGCDSILTLNLIITNPTSNTINQTACESYTLTSQTYTSSGTYTQTLINSSGCDSILTLNLTIDTIDVSLSIGNATIFANQNGATYQWLDCSNNYAPIINETNQSISGFLGDCAVEITINGCTDTSACVNLFTTSINQSAINNEDLIIFPNPTTHQFQVSSTKFKVNSVRIINVLGEQVLQSEINNPQSEINISKLSKGIYIVEVQTNGGMVRKKLVKE